MKTYWMHFVLLLLIAIIGGISIKNYKALDKQQHYLQNTLSTLSSERGTYKHNPPASLNTKEEGQDQNSSSEFSRLETEIQDMQVQLTKLTTIQQQLKQTLLQQKEQLAQSEQRKDTLFQTTVTDDNQNSENTLSEQDFQQEQAQAQIEEETHINQLMSDLEASWQNDVIVGAENVITEATLREGLTKTEGVNIVDLACKSKTCKIELQQTADTDADIDDSLLLNEAFMNSTVFRREFANPDGSQRIVMYLTQQE